MRLPMAVRVRIRCRPSGDGKRRPTPASSRGASKRMPPSIEGAAEATLSGSVLKLAPKDQNAA